MEAAARAQSTRMSSLTFGIEKPGDSILSFDNMECLFQSLAIGAVANVSPVNEVRSAKEKIHNSKQVIFGGISADFNTQARHIQLQSGKSYTSNLNFSTIRQKNYKF